MREAAVAENQSMRGVVVSHGTLAEAMVAAVQRIAGNGAEVLSAVSNEGRGPDELRSAILAAAGEHPAVVFTDLGAGSCTLAARMTCKDSPSLAVITGVNLPMLLDFVFHSDLDFDELLPRLEDKARSGISILSRP